jgi:hypothetical protein
MVISSSITNRPSSTHPRKERPGGLLGPLPSIIIGGKHTDGTLCARKPIFIFSSLIFLAGNHAPTSAFHASISSPRITPVLQNGPVTKDIRSTLDLYACKDTYIERMSSLKTNLIAYRLTTLGVSLVILHGTGTDGIKRKSLVQVTEGPAPLAVRHTLI